MTDVAGININKASSPPYAPAIPLPPYSYVPGHDLPHPVNDPAGHLYAVPEQAHELPTDAAMLAGNTQWLYALDLFNGGFYWEAHETWEGFWHAFGRTSPEAKFVQGLIHLAAAAVKIREGKPAGVARHTHGVPASCLAISNRHRLAALLASHKRAFQPWSPNLKATPRHAGTPRGRR